MFESTDNTYLVPFDGTFKYISAATAPPQSDLDKKRNKKKRKKLIDRLDELQQVLYASDKYALLLIFQAMDAAGKDSTIRAVMSGINPAGCQTFSFKQPTPQELDHDFLWRSSSRLPERGRIGIFNRSYYEEVLVVRVHPEYLKGQKLPYKIEPGNIWRERYESIRDHEKHLARNGTIILKFWLNVSRDEQKRRFLSRLEVPEKNYKFATSDVKERGFWNKYMQAYQDALNATSRSWAPWYAIPADDKPFMRACVADIIVQSLQKLNLRYPTVGKQMESSFTEMKKKLKEENKL